MTLLKGKQLVLASQSPRRAELLRQAGIPFTVRASTFEENLNKGLGPVEYARATAVAKGQAVYRSIVAEENLSSTNIDDELVVLAADTIVEGLPGHIWEKPQDAAEARAMLLSLSNRSHDVHTGFALISGLGVRSMVVTTSVKFMELEDASIDAYVASGSPLDKAGGYGIQDMWMVDGIVGDYFNVVGLPVSRVLKELRDLCE